jgi:ribonuclease H / adenosylcobalamin/alpha-ribazole phosphatase
MDIMLVRHATCAQMDDVLLGRSLDQPLDARGEAQARALARRLQVLRSFTLESSPRRRARHTAGIIAAQRDLPIGIAPQMDEIDFGSWSGCSFAALARDPQWQRWNRYRAVSRTPAGDSIRDVQGRALAHFRELQARCDDGAAVIVTHAEVIRSMALLAMGAPIDEYIRVEISPASVTALTMQGSELRLDRLNEQVAA